MSHQYKGDEMLRFAVVTFTVTILVVVVLPVSAQQMLEDVIYLKNGDVIRGTLIAQVIGQSITIQTSGGSEFTYTMDQITKIAKEPVTTMPTTTLKEKTPGVAALCSLLIVGTGQLYNEEPGKAIIHWLIAGTSIAMMVTGNNDNYGYYDPDGDDDVALLGLMIGGGNLLWSIINASAAAKRFNERQLQQRQKQVSLAPIKLDDAFGANLAFRF
jgi:hypothetical protein